MYALLTTKMIWANLVSCNYVWTINICLLFVIFTAAPSEPPRNLSVEHSTTSQATLQWKPVHEYFINGKLRGYKVKYKETKDPAGAWKNVIIRVNDTQQSRRKRSVSDDSVSLNLEDLKPYTTYTIIVLAFTVKDGVPTLATNFTTAEDGMLNCLLISNKWAL